MISLGEAIAMGSENLQSLEFIFLQDPPMLTHVNLTKNREKTRRVGARKRFLRIRVNAPTQNPPAIIYRGGDLTRRLTAFENGMQISARITVRTQQGIAAKIASRTRDVRWPNDGLIGLLSKSCIDGAWRSQVGWSPGQLGASEVN